MRHFIAGFEENLHQVVVLGLVRRKLVVCVSKEEAAVIVVRRVSPRNLEEPNAERCYRRLVF